jgi:hypothetical protein
VAQRIKKLDIIELHAIIYTTSSKREKIMNLVKIHMKTDNAAFEDEGKATEIARILRELAGRIESEGINYALLRDVNGNRVGHFEHYINS